MLGKYLSPRLYVSYGISLTEQLNTLKLRYSLNDRWTVQDRGGRGPRRGPRLHHREVASSAFLRDSSTKPGSTAAMASIDAWAC